LPERYAGLSVFRILLHNPPVAREIGATLNTLLFEGNVLDARLRELLIMRIGWVMGSVYEWTAHWRVARGLQIPDADILAVRDWRTADNLSDADKAVLRATDECLERGFIQDDTWAEVCRHVQSDAERVELVIAIGNWSLFAQLLQSLDVPLEAQFYSGTAFQQNLADNCSTYRSALASLSGFAGNLAPTDTSVIAPGLDTALTAGEHDVLAPLLLLAPGLTNDGSVDVLLDVPAWLEFDWQGGGDEDPVGTATFGRFRGHDRILYWREVR